MRKDSSLIGLLAYVALLSGGALFLLASLGGLSGQGFWLQSKGRGSLLTGIPGFVMGFAFLCLSLACFVPVLLKLLRRSLESAAASFLLLAAAFGLAVLAIVLDLLAVGVPDDSPTLLRAFAAVGIAAAAIWTFRRKR
jgi:hypothetical protein